MIHLDLHDPRPMYEQIVEQIEKLVARGVWQADDKVPSVRQMAMELSLNPNTVQKAYSELLGRGVIYSVKGKGNFVSDNQEKIKETKLMEIREEIRQLLQQAKELGITIQECNELLDSLKEVEKK